MATINKAELIKEVADSTDLNKTQSDQAIDAVFSAHLQRAKRFNLLASVLLKLETVLLVRAVTHKLVQKLIFLQLRFLHLSQVRA